MSQAFFDPIAFELEEPLCNAGPFVEVTLSEDGKIDISFYGEDEIGADSEEVISLTAAEARKLQKALKKARKHLHRENN